MAKVKKYLAALAAIAGIAAGYGLGSADVVGKVTLAIKAAQAAAEVVAPEAPAPAPAEVAP